MLHFNLEDNLINKNLIKNSIYYAIHSRLNNDYFCDFFELNINCKDKIKINQLVEYIRNIYLLSEPYIQDESFAYAYPKNDLFIRKCIYLPFKEYAVRYHLINTLSLAVENCFINTSYAHRTQRSTTKSEFLPLFKEYYPEYKKFIKGAEYLLKEFKQNNQESYLLKADITAFYDSISHHYLIDAIFELLGNILPRKYEELLKQILKPKFEFYSIIDESLKSINKHQGLLVGNITDGYLANILLTRIDELMIAHGFNYARYVDDIKIITTTKDNALKAVNILQEELYRIGLTLNSAKTEIIHNPSSVEDLLRKNHLISMQDILNENFNVTTQQESLEEDEDIRLKDILNINFSEKLKIEEVKKITKFLNKLKSNNDYDEEFLVYLIEKIPEMILLFPETINTHTWTVVKLINFGYSNKIIFAGYKAMNGIFKDRKIMDYARTRLIHHLIKPRKKDPPYILMMVKNNDSFREKLISIFQKFLSAKSIDLNLNSLYALWILSHKENGSTFDEILFHQTIDNYLPRPISHTISRVLASILSYKDSLNFFDDFDFTAFSDNAESVGLDDLNYQ